MSSVQQSQACRRALTLVSPPVRQLEQPLPSLQTVSAPLTQSAAAIISKDDEVVEYALNRSLSPALIAEYQTQLPDKALLQAKLHEFYALNTAQGEEQ